jgi:putative polyhydroxyalkanoate system protein
MAKIAIHHKHNQPEHVVREMLGKLLAQLHKEYDITSVANGQHIDFHRSGASGKLSIHPHQVDIDIKLSMMLSMFERKIKDTITQYCEEHLP